MRMILGTLAYWAGASWLALHLIVLWAVLLELAWFHTGLQRAQLW